VNQPWSFVVQLLFVKEAQKENWQKHDGTIHKHPQSLRVFICWYINIANGIGGRVVLVACHS
jgi:hypothetical protein